MSPAQHCALCRGRSLECRFFFGGEGGGGGHWHRRRNPEFLFDFDFLSVCIDENENENENENPRCAGRVFRNFVKNFCARPDVQTSNFKLGFDGPKPWTWRLERVFSPRFRFLAMPSTCAGDKI